MAEGGKKVRLHWRRTKQGEVCGHCGWAIEPGTKAAQDRDSGAWYYQACADAMVMLGKATFRITLPVAIEDDSERLREER